MMDTYILVIVGVVVAFLAFFALIVCLRRCCCPCRHHEDDTRDGLHDVRVVRFSSDLSYAKRKEFQFFETVFSAVKCQEFYDLLSGFRKARQQVDNGKIDWSVVFGYHIAYTKVIPLVAQLICDNVHQMNQLQLREIAKLAREVYEMRLAANKKGRRENQEEENVRSHAFVVNHWKDLVDRIQCLL